MCKNAREIQTVDCMIILPIFTLLARIIVDNYYSRLKDASIGFGIRQTSARNADRIDPFPKNYRLFQTFRRNNGCWHFSKKTSFLPASTFRAEKHRQTAATTIVWRYVTKRIEQISLFGHLHSMYYGYCAVISAVIFGRSSD